jgi:hypothetical protein
MFTHVRRFGTRHPVFWLIGFTVLMLLVGAGWAKLSGATLG